MADDMPPGLVIFALGFFLLLAFVLLLWAVNVLPGKLHEIMSRMMAPVQSDSPGLDQSIDQSAPTSLEPQTSSQADAGLDTPAPDMEAGNWDMPRISAYLTDHEFLVFLARQKNSSGGWRLSANQIVKTIGGDRTEVLKTIREVRDGPAEHRPLTPEQQATRQALGLEEK